VKYINYKGIQTEPEIHQVFFQWVYNVFTNPGNDKLPLLGSFVLKNQADQKFTLSASNFVESQIFLMHYFSDTKSCSRTLQVALSLIGYWYKNQKNEYFNQLFHNDEEYWDAVINLLKPKFNSKGVHTLKPFAIS
jgi:hypothetical protein